MDTGIDAAMEEDVTKSDLLDLELATWNQPRNQSQLLDFITRREAELAQMDQ